MAQQLGSNYYNSPYKFNGKELDEETGFYYYGARYYDPRISIFQSVDPLVEQTMDAYGYCYQNPINLIDPTGMIAKYPIYGKNGKYLGDDGRKGGDLAFVGESDGKGGFKNLQQFTSNHTEFKNSVALIEAESSQTGNAETALWMAHTVENARGSRSFNQKFKTGYSSLGDKSISISTGDNSNTANYARAGLIDVLLGGKDPTGGAKYWDGLDFFTNKSIGLNQKKFKEYQSVTISNPILQSALGFWDSQTNRNKVNGNAPMNCMYYGKGKGLESVENGSVFRSNYGFTAARSSSQTDPKVHSRIIATGFKAGTIFWKELPKK